MRQAILESRIDQHRRQREQAAEAGSSGSGSGVAGDSVDGVRDIPLASGDGQPGPPDDTPGTSQGDAPANVDEVLEQLLSQVAEAPPVTPVSENAAAIIKAFLAEGVKEVSNKEFFKKLAETLARPDNLVGKVPRTNPPIFKNLSDKCQKRDSLLQQLQKAILLSNNGLARVLDNVAVPGDVRRALKPIFTAIGVAYAIAHNLRKQNMSAGLPLRLTKVLSDARFKPAICMFGDEWLSLGDGELIQQLITVSKSNDQMQNLLKTPAKASPRFKPYDKEAKKRTSSFLGDGRQKNRPNSTWKSASASPSGQRSSYPKRQPDERRPDKTSRPRPGQQKK